MDAILQDKTVVDLTRLLPGPLCTMYLADLGARVVKVEQPGTGDYARWGEPRLGDHAALFTLLNRNKQSLALNLKHERGREVLMRLVAEADVLVESFRPGVLERLDLAPDTLHERNPELVIGRLSGYGQESPHRDEPGHDLNYIALAGLLSQLEDTSGEPVHPGFQMADVAGGAYMGLVGLLGGLVHQERTGEGQVVDVSMTDAMVPFLISALAPYFATGEAPGPGSDALRGGWANYGLYRCRDDRWLALGALEPQFVEALAEALDRPDLQDMEYGSRSFRETLQDVFLRRDRDEWMQRLRGQNCPVTPVNGLNDLVDSDHAEARDLFPRLPESEGGHPQVGFPVRFSDTPTTIRSGPPDLGEDAASILRDLGYSSEDVAALRDEDVLGEAEG